MIQILKYLKVFEIFWPKVHQNAISDLQTKFQLILKSTFWNFQEKSLESVLGRKSHFYSTFDSNFKILKTFRNFLVKSTSECYFWLANKVSTDSNEYFLKFSWKWKVFRISFRPKKVTFRPLLIQTLKYWKVFEIVWSKVHQNAISDLQTKFQVILTSTFWNFHEKSLESVLGRKSHF